MKRILANESGTSRSRWYRIYIVFILAVIGIQILGPLVMPDALGWVCAAGILCPVVYLLCISFCRLRGKILMLLLLLVGFLAPLFFYERELRKEFFRGLYSWVTGIGSWTDEYRNYYHFIGVVFIGLFLCILAFLAERSVLLRRVLGLGLFLYLLMALVQGWECSQKSVACILLYDIICVVEYIQTMARKKDFMIGKRSIVYLLPFLGLYFLLLLGIPADNEPYDWKIFSSIIDQAEKVRIMLSQKWGRTSNDGFGVQFTGFGGRPEVGGNINSRQRDEMRMKTGRNMKTNIYLTGRIFDTFDGKEWHNTSLEGPEDYRIDYLETLYAIRRYDPDNLYDYLSQGSISLTYHEMNTKYLFAPLKSYKLNMKSAGADFFMEQGELQFEKRMGYGTEYDVLFLQMNLNNPGFNEMLRQESSYQYGSSREGEAAWNLLLTDYMPEAKGSITEAALKIRADKIRQHYLGNPELSPGVAAYLERITEGCESDLEKLRAIEKELSGYSYTTSPGDIPEEKDFLDYFLLERQNGYCTYFATAFILLARAEGIPARYVQGFCIEAKGSSEISMQVSSAMSHAWPEVYMEGIGWIPFEPTPEFGEVRYQPWQVNSKEVPDAPLQWEPEEESSMPVPELPGNIGESPLIIAMQEEPEKTRTKIAIPFIVLSVIVLVFVGDSFLRKRRYESLDIRSKIYAEVNSNLKLLGFMGLGLKEGETLEELQKRIWESPELPGTHFYFIPLFEKVRYGEREAESDILRKVIEERQILMEAIKRKSRVRYYWMRMK